MEYIGILTQNNVEERLATEGPPQNMNQGDPFLSTG